MRNPRKTTCSLGEAAAEIIGRPAFALSRSRTDLDLVVVTPAQLGLAGESVPVAAVYARGEGLGFALVGAKSGGIGLASINVTAPPAPVQTPPQQPFTCPLG